MQAQILYDKQKQIRSAFPVRFLDCYRLEKLCHRSWLSRENLCRRLKKSPSTFPQTAIKYITRF
jgi:hypothetical protein